MVREGDHEVNMVPAELLTDKPRLLDHTTLPDEDGSSFIEHHRFVCGGNESEAMAKINAVAAALNGEVAEVEWQRDPPAVLASIVSPAQKFWI